MLLCVRSFEFSRSAMAAMLRRGAFCGNDHNGNAAILLREALGGFKRGVIVFSRRAHHRHNNERVPRALYERCVISCQI